MKSLLNLWLRMHADASIQCRASAGSDAKTVRTRFENEGLQFLTITLPAYGKEFERSLDLGQVSNGLAVGFARSQQKAGLPRFLGGFLCLIFERKSGRLLDVPSVDAIQAVRLLTQSFGKILLPCSDARNEAAFTDYIKCEQSVMEAELPSDGPLVKDFQRISTMLFGDVLSKIDRDVYEGRITPRHGPGATADRLRGNAKYQQTEWTERLEEIFPAGEFLLPNWRYHQQQDTINWLEPGAERPVRVITVPKTMKTPRIIAIEPTCMQYVQQGLMMKFVEYLESDSLVQGMIGFTDQTPNQRLACEGSREGNLATLDLSEASDRVSMQHVRVLFANYPWLAKAVDACRSRKADVPGYGVQTLSKFASMGSALTFPVEEMVFLTVVLMGIEKELRRRLTRRDVKIMSGSVRVYGDDIIVPVESTESVISVLESFGFKVNRSKSFWTGKFRESCGKEYYDGHDVSIYRVRRVLPSSRTDVPELLSAVSLRNQAYESGYWGVAGYLDELLEELIPFPSVGLDAPCIGRHSFLGYSPCPSERYDVDLQRPLVRVMKVVARPPVSRLDGEGALLKFFLKQGVETADIHTSRENDVVCEWNLPSADREHLERQGRPKSVGMKLGWACPY